MATPVSIDRTADDRSALVQKVALVHKVRRLADAVESLYRGLDEAGALPEIRRYSQLHYEQIPPRDLLQIDGVLRLLRGESLATRQHCETVSVYAQVIAM